MVYRILLILAYWLYFLGEGVTEGLTWKMGWEDFTANSRTYHTWRVVENLGLIGVILLIGFVHPANWLIISLLSAVGGLIIYLRCFSYGRHDNFWHHSQSEWFGISKPNITIQIVIFIISVVSLGYILI